MYGALNSERGLKGSIAQRLQDALRRSGSDKKAFAADMRSRLGDRGGVSYPTVLGYFDGSALPSVEWLTAAADILDVRAAWLAFGDGAMTQEQQDRLTMRPEGDSVDDEAARVTLRVENQVRAAFGLDGIGIRFSKPDPAFGALMLAFEIADTTVPVAGDEPEWLSRCANDAVEAVLSPLYRLGLEPSALPIEAYVHYLTTVMEELRYLYVQLAELRND